jgi:ketosteroid isomerase-like protein
MTSSHFDQAIAQSHAALNTMMSGNPDGFKNLYSTADDVILGNPFGGFARGYEQVTATLERAGSNFRDGTAEEFETLARWEGADVAYTFEIERAKVKVAGASEITDVAVRVTSIFRREDNRWKLVLRHADPGVGRLAAESVFEA